MLKFTVMCFMLAGFELAAQSFTEAIFSPGERVVANTALHVDYLNNTEKEVIEIINLARLYPGKFADEFLPAFTAQTDEFSNTENYRSLIADLKKMKPLTALKPNEYLYKHAQVHASDMGKTGKTGHGSSSGKSFGKRMAPVRDRFAGVGENCQYGYPEALYIVVDLLIDEGIPDVGHRINILEPRFVYIGVSVENHKKYGVNTVQIFAAEEK